MATNIKISSLPAGGVIDGTEQLPIVQSGQTVRSTIDLIKSFVIGSKILPSQALETTSNPTFNSLKLSTSPTISSTEQGQLYFDVAEQTFTGVTGNTSLQIGQELYIRVYNNTGSLITNGSVVYISGAYNDRPTVALARSDVGATSDNTVGICTEDIPNGSIGTVTTYGIVHNLNTSSFAVGQNLYLSSTLAGGFVSSIPASPNIQVGVGVVLTTHSSLGQVLVRVDVSKNQSKILATGILKGSGAGTVTSATQGVDYAPATIGSSILKASSGGFANATATDVVTLIGTTYVQNASYATNAGNATSANNSLLTSQRTIGRVKTDGISAGSYGSISVSGTTNGYAGIRLDDLNATWMASGGVSFGSYNHSNSSWYFYFDTSGVLQSGTIPWARVSGVPTNLNQFTNGPGFQTASGTVSSSTYLQSTSHPGTYYLSNYWTGSYWRIISNHPSGVSVAHADLSSNSGALGGWGLSVSSTGNTVMGRGGSGETYAHAYYYASDASLKHDIKDLTNSIQIVNQIKGRTFKWNDNDKQDVGFIANEVLEVLPEAVTVAENGILSISSTQIIAHLVEAVKDLNKRLESLGA